ncbi:MAG: glutathione S-transferase family protein [Pseudomonadota bacterium]|nr:glutathione S-transferase family protein [Pseudomonadota bacterium]
MKLYTTPKAATNLAARILGLSVDMEKVDMQTRKTARGESMDVLNPRGYVPFLKLDNGEILTENAVVLQYLADLKPQAGLIPPAGTMQRYRVQEWLNFIGTELHKNFAPLFYPVTPGHRENALANLDRRFGFLDSALAGKQYLMGDSLTVADLYAFVMVANYADYHKISLDKWPNIKAYRARLEQHPKMKEALKAEEALAAA